VNLQSDRSNKDFAKRVASPTIHREQKLISRLFPHNLPPMQSISHRLATAMGVTWVLSANSIEAPPNSDAHEASASVQSSSKGATVRKRPTSTRSSKFDVPREMIAQQLVRENDRRKSRVSYDFFQPTSQGQIRGLFDYHAKTAPSAAHARRDTIHSRPVSSATNNSTNRKRLMWGETWDCSCYLRNASTAAPNPPRLSTSDVLHEASVLLMLAKDKAQSIIAERAAHDELAT